MEKLEDWETLELINYIQFANSQEWEMTRLLLSCYVDHKKVKKLTDIIQFPWDEDYVKDEVKKTISNEDIQRLKTKANELSKYIEE